MIQTLHIQNFAIIRELEAELHTGLCVVTGETGAGKSVVIEALSLALGARADRSMVRAGSEKAQIVLAMDPERVLTREVSASGKSLCKIDGEIVTLAQLQELTAGLVDIHGQYDHQSLLAAERHIGLLDLFGGEEIAYERERVQEAYGQYDRVRRSLTELKRDAAAAERELDFLRFEVREIEAARPVVGEDDELGARVRVMQSGEKIYEALNRAYAALSGDSGEASLTGMAGDTREALSSLSDFGADFSGMALAASDAYFALEDLQERVRRAMDGAEFSQKELDDALARLDLLNRLKKKYGGSLEETLAYLEKARARLSNIENADAQRETLERELAVSETALSEASEELSRLRRAAAERLEIRITAQLEELNFKDARFQIAIESEPGAYTDNGFDRVEFLLSANKGQPLLPLVKVASGGELSRIMLAFKAVTSQFDGIETMIFDEIDSGISGVTASIVGEKLRRMAAGRQIVCITHLPQIAACAAHHYVLEKETDEAGTFTAMREIAGEERVREIARLLGGKSVTETTLRNAEELIRLSGE